MVEIGFAQEVIKPAGRRIVGGEKTDVWQDPWQVALQFMGTSLAAAPHRPALGRSARPPDGRHGPARNFGALLY
jgi:hypothetical protein